MPVSLDSFDMRKQRIMPLVLLAVSLLAACGQQKSPAELAAQSLEEGLKAHAEGRLDDATKAYRQVLVHDSANKFAYYNLGLIDQTNERQASAETNYRRALEFDPNFAEAMFNLAILVTTKDSEEAKSLYEKLLAGNPDYANGHLNLGFLLLSMGRTAEGNAELDKAVALDPSLAERRGAPAPSPSPTSLKRP